MEKCVFYFMEKTKWTFWSTQYFIPASVTPNVTVEETTNHPPNQPKKKKNHTQQSTLKANGTKTSGVSSTKGCNVKRMQASCWSPRSPCPCESGLVFDNLWLSEGYRIGIPCVRMWFHYLFRTNRHIKAHGSCQS